MKLFLQRELFLSSLFLSPKNSKAMRREAASLLRRASSLRCRGTITACSGAHDANPALDARRWLASMEVRGATTTAPSTSTSSSRSFASAGIAAAAASAAAAALALSLARSSCEPENERAPGGEASAPSSPAPPPPSCPLCHAAPWVLSLSTAPETREILSAEALAASAKYAGRGEPSSTSAPSKSKSKAPAFLGGDHMFSALLRHDLVRDLVALYQPQHKKMRYIIQLGKRERKEGFALLIFHFFHRDDEERLAFGLGNQQLRLARKSALVSSPTSTSRGPRLLLPLRKLLCSSGTGSFASFSACFCRRRRERTQEKKISLSRFSISHLSFLFTLPIPPDLQAKTSAATPASSTAGSPPRSSTSPWGFYFMPSVPTGNSPSVVPRSLPLSK